MKRCSTCERELTRDQFYTDRSRKDGLCHNCKSCRNAISSQRIRASGGYGIPARMKTYGLTRQEVEAYLQIPACQICNKKFLSDSEVHFDHCHERGHIRGVLCGVCNRCLQGTASQCIVRNERANDYLLRDMEVRLEPAGAG